ncbi:hypothetical protein HPB51_001058 [Rhipicephalus microplus]|uniref:Uncharacterized protein n=1 Tax=Rhipicephalus microplus TaxID=6941 RepID=A0A9J6DSB6_RHIMP|nr:hypothetical protein HPB51_001058 [Rhipicephalus microplus]
MRFVRVARPRRLCVAVAVLYLLVVLASDRKQQRRLIPVQLPGSPASVKVIMRPKMVDRQLGIPPPQPRASEEAHTAKQHTPESLIKEDRPPDSRTTGDVASSQKVGEPPELPARAVGFACSRSGSHALVSAASSRRLRVGASADNRERSAELSVSTGRGFRKQVQPRAG